MIELRTEGARSNTVHTWRLYWFHESDLDASCPADAKTLEEAGYVPLARAAETHLTKIAQLAEATGKLIRDSRFISFNSGARRTAADLLAAVAAWRETKDSSQAALKGEKVSAGDVAPVVENTGRLRVNRGWGRELRYCVNHDWAAIWSDDGVSRGPCCIECGGWSRGSTLLQQEQSERELREQLALVERGLADLNDGCVELEKEHAALKTQNKDANKMTEVTKAHRKALFDALDWYPQNQAERDWIETGVGEPPTGSVVGRELVRVARAIAEAEARGPGDNTILYRGSVTDLATDVAAELTPEQATELVQELERFRSSEPGKFLRLPIDPQRG